MPRKKLQEHVVRERIEAANKFVKFTGKYDGMCTPAEFTCLRCERCWYARPHNVLHGSACPHCSRIRVDLTEIHKKLRSRGILIQGEYKSRGSKVKFECLVCSTSWAADACSVIHTSGCPKCAADRRRRALTLSPEDLSERLRARGIQLVGEYVTARTRSQFKCAKGHMWQTTPDAIRRTGCPVCSGRVFDVKQFERDLSARGIRLAGPYTRSTDKTKFMCTKK